MEETTTTIVESITKIEGKPLNAMLVAAAAYAGYRICRGTFDTVSCWIEEAKRKAQEMKQEAQQEAAAEGA